MIFSYDNKILQPGMTVYCRHEYPIYEYTIVGVYDKIECKNTLECMGKTYHRTVHFYPGQLVVDIVPRKGYFYVWEGDESKEGYISDVLDLQNYVTIDEVALLLKIIETANVYDSQDNASRGKFYYGSPTIKNLWKEININDLIIKVFKDYLNSGDKVKLNLKYDYLKQWFRDNTTIYN
jgi:hypothetical protein